jgi:hypothetical protein
MSLMTIQEKVSGSSQPVLTKHAWERMSARSVSAEAVETALDHGRIVRIRGAEIHAVGRKEVEKLYRDGIDISRFEGVQVVCSPEGTILTVYKNRDFSGLRPRRCRRRIAA